MNTRIIMMEATLPHRPSLLFNKNTNTSSRIHQTQLLINKNSMALPACLSLNAGKKHGLATRCVAVSSGPMVEISPEEKEEFTSMKEKCKEREGVVELLECLETEAIMGEDEGKDPGDYNRRAKIFDKSSRVFQALKESNNDSKASQQ